MTRKDGWEKSSSGPDWVDVEMAIRALDAIHSGKTGVLISPRGIGGSGGLHIVITTCWENVPGSAAIEGVDTVGHWPNSGGGTLAAYILGGLYRHDFAVGQAYQQRDFTKA